MKKIEERNNWKGMIIIALLMITDVSIIYFTWDGMIINCVNIFNYVNKNGITLFFSIFFIGLGLYCWKMFFYNVIIKAKKETLYLKNIENDIYSFIDLKGKKYVYKSISNREYEIDNYYTVMKTKNIIKVILEKSNDNFPICKERISFFLNSNNTTRNFENMFLLPTFYIIFLSAFLYFIMSKGYDVIYGLIFMFVSGIFIAYKILYKIVYKIKRNKEIEKTEKNENVDCQSNEFNKIDLNTKLSSVQKESLFWLQPILKIIVGLIILWFSIRNYIEDIDMIALIVIMVFLICGLVILISGIVELVCNLIKHKISAINQNSDNNNEDIEKYKEKQLRRHKLSILLSKISILLFLLCWYSFLIVWCYFEIKLKNYEMAILSIPFWIIGIVEAYKKFKKL